MWFSHSWFFFLGFFHEFKNTMDKAIINFNSEEKKYCIVFKLYINEIQILWRHSPCTCIHGFLGAIRVSARSTNCFKSLYDKHMMIASAVSHANVYTVWLVSSPVSSPCLSVFVVAYSSEAYLHVFFCLPFPPFILPCTLFICNW